MRPFAIALTALFAVCVTGSALAQGSIAEQMRALREQRGGGSSSSPSAGTSTNPSPSPSPAGGGVPIPAPTQASLDGAALAEAKSCLSCHAVEETVYGPAYKDIAAKYEYSADDIVRLMGSIRNGSKGAWKDNLGVSLEMPASTLVNDEEAKKLVVWILKMKK